ncbi:hypothetical protein D3C72_1234430 [compost metagenome]
MERDLGPIHFHLADELGMGLFGQRLEVVVAALLFFHGLQEDAQIAALGAPDLLEPVGQVGDRLFLFGHEGELAVAEDRVDRAHHLAVVEQVVAPLIGGLAALGEAHARGVFVARDLEDRVVRAQRRGEGVDVLAAVLPDRGLPRRQFRAIVGPDEADHLLAAQQQVLTPLIHVLIRPSRSMLLHYRRFGARRKLNLDLKQLYRGVYRRHATPPASPPIRQTSPPLSQCHPFCKPR